MVGVTIAPDDHPSAFLQIPSATPSGAKRNVPCTFHGMDGKRLVLETHEPVEISTAASIEVNDAMFIGEVVICNRTANGVWELELKIEHVLSGLHSLMALRAQLLGEAAAPVSEMASVVVMNRN